MANMGGTWLAIVYGFAGLRIKESGLSLSPSIPDKWKHFAFNLEYQGCQISIGIDRQRISLVLKKGNSLTMKLYDEKITLREGQYVERKLISNIQTKNIRDENHEKVI